MTARLLICACLLIWLSGCGSSVDFELPDMSGVEPLIVEAIEESYRSVQSAPDSAEAWGGLADRLRGHQWRAAAAECYARAEQLEPENFVWPYRIGMSLRRLDQQGAAAAIERAMKIDDGYAPAHEKYASIKASLGETDTARAHYQKCVQLAPDFSHCHLGLGKLAFRGGDLEQARVHLEQALRHNPRHAEVRIALSQVYLALGFEGPATQHADASRTLPKRTDYPDPRSISSLEPAGAKAHAERGALLENMGQPDAAEKHYRESIRLNPGARGALFNLGLMLARRGEFDEALDLLERAVELKDTDVDAIEGYARVLLEAGREQDAFTQMRRVLEIDPTRTPTRLELGQMLFRTGHDAEAAAEFSSLIEQRPRWAEPLFQLAWIRAVSADSRERRPAEALRLSRKAEDMAYSITPRQQDILAAAHAATGDFAKATEIAEAALARLTAQDAGLAADLRVRLELYRQGKAFRAKT